MSQNQSIFDRLGTAAVEAAVDLFYTKVLNDEFLSPFFEGINMARQKKKQAQFLTFVFGGPNDYQGRSMRAAHLHLIRNKGLSLEHFDKVASHFVATLTELNVPSDIIDEATEILLSTRDQFGPLTDEEQAASTSGDTSSSPEEAEVPTKKSLYDQLGREAISAAVDLFYKKMLSDPRVNIFFEGLDMSAQKRKQASFLCYVFGGPEAYKGKQLRSAHMSLIKDKGLNMEHFDITAQHFVATLQELNVPQPAIDEATGVLLSTRKFFEPLTPEELKEMSAEVTSADKKPSIFDRLGEAAVTAAVEEFYKRMLADDRVNKFFQGVNMKVQKHKQAQFLSYAFGGPEGYKGKDLRTAHLHLIRDKGLNMTHFDIVAEHFVATLHHLSVPQDIVDEATATLLGTKKYFEPLTKEEETAMAKCPHMAAGKNQAAEDGDVGCGRRHMCTTC